MENPDEPDVIRPEFDAEDGMHPNNAGARVLVATVDLADLGL
ncbi:hypothetical protein GCM10009555_097060 [Acrocarpospora macrocephala]|uniref:SGNH hydrolase-type esterase domain-containing protein n=1 Tax=Acrocarpospora macrocephala TaxID=150177 RepID=A0A5M3WMG3_9ACTN|nr:hypothetical protein [Acrocarpospora macrocephala]GES09349.1 hypothetical protein Amac_029450 [Acrocarpospora macrocephala]